MISASAVSNASEICPLNGWLYISVLDCADCESELTTGHGS